LNTSSHGSFIHLTSSDARSVLDIILASISDGSLDEKTLEKEIPEIATPEPMPETSQPIAIEHIESPQEEISLPDFINDIEDDLFSYYGNTSKYHKEKGPRKHTSFSHEKIDPFEQTFSREHTLDLACIMSGEWLEELELSSDVVHLDSPSIPIQCTINGTLFDALYNPVVGIIIMALSFFHQFIKNKPLSPTMKILKCSSWQIIQSSGILYVLPFSVYDMSVHLSFHICDIKEFDLLIGYPLGKLLKEGHTEKLDVCLGKIIKVSLHFSHSIHTKTEHSPKPDPMEEVNEASLEHLI
jgi:hypothetical protein